MYRPQYTLINAYCDAVLMTVDPQLNYYKFPILYTVRQNNKLIYLSNNKYHI